MQGEGSGKDFNADGKCSFIAFGYWGEEEGVTSFNGGKGEQRPSGAHLYTEEVAGGAQSAARGQIP
jgi:hypothetical protein